jgi:hypothetical protein
MMPAMNLPKQVSSNNSSIYLAMTSSRGHLRRTSPLGSASEMHEELSMSDINRLKRAAIPLGAIVALSASAVLAQDRLTKDDLATLAATLGVYDSRCETLPPRLRTDLQRMVRLLDKDDLMARGLNEQEKVDRAGEAKWCDAYRPVIEKYKDGLFEPTR